MEIFHSAPCVNILSLLFISWGSNMDSVLCNSYRFVVGLNFEL